MVQEGSIPKELLDEIDRFYGSYNPERKSNLERLRDAQR